MMDHAKTEPEAVRNWGAAEIQGNLKDLCIDSKENDRQSSMSWYFIID